MSKTEDLQVYIEDVNKNIIRNVTNSSKLFLEKKDLLRIFGLNKRQIEMYLFRNKDIKTYKHEKQTLIEIKILDYVFKSIARKKKY